MREEDLYPKYVLHLQRALPKCRLWVNAKKFRDDRGIWRNVGLTEGAADLIGLVQGRYLEVEVKMPTGKQLTSQREHMSVVRAMGGIYVLARSPETAEQLIREELSR